MYKQVELQDGNKVQFVGVYATRWQREWGPATIGFIEVDYQLPDAITELNNIVELDTETYNKVLAILKKLDPYT